LTGHEIGPLEREAEPSTVALKGVVVDDNPNTGPVPAKLCKLSRISIPRDLSIPVRVMSQVSLADAGRDEVELAIDPHTLPPVKKITRHSFFRHFEKSSFNSEITYIMAPDSIVSASVARGAVHPNASRSGDAGSSIGCGATSAA
jgi:hypothetical protein